MRRRATHLAASENHRRSIQVSVLVERHARATSWSVLREDVDTTRKHGVLPKLMFVR